MIGIYVRFPGADDFNWTEKYFETEYDAVRHIAYDINVHFIAPGTQVDIVGKLDCEETTTLSEFIWKDFRWTETKTGLHILYYLKKLAPAGS